MRGRAVSQSLLSSGGGGGLVRLMRGHGGQSGSIHLVQLRWMEGRSRQESIASLVRPCHPSLPWSNQTNILLACWPALNCLLQEHERADRSAGMTGSIHASFDVTGGPMRPSALPSAVK